MRKKALQICGFTLAAGVFGAFLRWLQNLRAFEKDTGLQIINSPLSLAMAIYLALAALLLLIVVRRQRSCNFSGTYPAIYAAAPSLLPLFSLATGILIGAGGLLTLLQAVLNSRKIFDLLLGLLSLLYALSAWLFLQGASAKKPPKNAAFSSAALVFCLCFWLIAAYKHSSADPVLWHFAPRLLSIAAAILSLYFAAGFVYGRPAPLSALYFSLLAAFLTLVVLGDNHAFGEQLITAGTTLLTLTLAYAQLTGAAEKTKGNHKTED